jgi:hypothetical protein
VVPSWLISYSKEEVAIQNQESKEKELKALKEVNKKKEVPARSLLCIKKEWRHKQVISASN